MMIITVEVNNKLSRNFGLEIMLWNKRNEQPRSRDLSSLHEEEKENPWELGVSTGPIQFQQNWTFARIVRKN